MVIVVKCCDSDIIGTCEDRIFKIVEFHDNFLLGSKESVPDGHVFQEVPEDPSSDRHCGRGPPYFEITKE